MRKIILFPIILFFSLVPLLGDYYVKAKVQRFAYMVKGKVYPPAQGESEMWLGRKKAALVSRNRIIILHSRKRIIFVNRVDKTYVKAKLPLKPEKILSSRIQEILKDYTQEINVFPTQKEIQIKEWPCQGFEMETATFNGDKLLNKTKMKVWATQQVPFKIDLYNQIHTNIIALLSPGKDYLTELKRLKGVRISSDINQFEENRTLMSKQEIVEITKKKPPKRIYKIPKGFKKKDKIDLKDLHYILND